MTQIKTLYDLDCAIDTMLQALPQRMYEAMTALKDLKQDALAVKTSNRNALNLRLKQATDHILEDSLVMQTAHGSANMVCPPDKVKVRVTGNVAKIHRGESPDEECLILPINIIYGSNGSIEVADIKDKEYAVQSYQLALVVKQALPEDISEMDRYNDALQIMLLTISGDLDKLDIMRQSLRKTGTMELREKVKGVFMLHHWESEATTDLVSATLKDLGYEIPPLPEWPPPLEA